MGLFVLINSDGHKPVHIVAEQVSAIVDFGSIDTYHEDGNTIEVYLPAVRVLTAGGHDIPVDGSLEDAVAAFNAAS